ncbi:unnamed protein product, partial [Ectocarpus sp. 8 AP-2014]
RSFLFVSNYSIVPEWSCIFSCVKSLLVMSNQYRSFVVFVSLGSPTHLNPAPSAQKRSLVFVGLCRSVVRKFRPRLYAPLASSTPSSPNPTKFTPTPHAYDR